MEINIQIKAALFLRPSSVTRIQSKNVVSFSSITEGEGRRAKCFHGAANCLFTSQPLTIFLYVTVNEKLKLTCTSTRFLVFRGKGSILKENKIILKKTQPQIHFITRNTL